jgi:hypothetical protein
MSAENDHSLPESAAHHDAPAQETLTDVIDELSRSAFQRALDRRHTAPTYRTVIESMHLVPTPPAS